MAHAVRCLAIWGLFIWLAMSVVAAPLSPAFAAGNSGITYHGRILRPDGSPLNSARVQFKIQIRSPGNENCLMYEEMQNRDMTNSGGVFAITLNDGTGTRTDGNSYSIDNIFANRSSFSFPSGACTTGSVYNTNASDGRQLVMYFRSDAMANWEQLPAQAVNFSPMAIESKQIGGFRPDNLLRVDDTAASSNATPFTSSQFSNLVGLINGTSTQYVKNSTATGATMPLYNGAPTTLTPGAVWFDTGSNNLKFYNGTAVMVVGAGGGGSGTVTGITVGTGLVDGLGATGTVITTAGTIALPNVGTAGTYYKVTTDAQGRVSSGAAALVEADIPNLSSAGKVSGSAITSGTIGGTTAVSTSGNLQTSGDITGKRIFVQDSGTNYAGFKAPTTVPTTYSLVLPTGLPGSNGMVLSSDTAGNLSWAAAGSGSVSSVTGTAPITVGGTASAPVVGITQATTTTDGYLSSADWNTFNSKLSGTLASGKIYVGNGSNVATAVTPSGDVTVTTAGGFTVTRIQGVAVSATAPTTAGQVLRYDGTSSYVPAQLTAADISGLSTTLGNKIDAAQMPANCGANQTLTFSSPTGTWSCSNIAITGSAFGSQAANTVLAAPNGSAGNPSFRALVAGDIPALDASKITTGTLPVAQGGTGTATGSITGTGALTFAAGGSNQSVTLSPSGTGATVLNGNVGIGTTTPAVSLDVSSQTDALALPRGTTGQQPASPAGGWIRYNTSNNLVEFYNGTAWTSLAAAGSGITSLTGDVTATEPGAAAATVVKVNGVTYPASPATNTVPVVTGAGTVTYQAVPVAAGGTGLTSLATNSLLYGNGTGNMNSLAPVNSAVLTSSAGGVPQWSALTADTFSQYALLAGRAGGQTLSGGTAASENLTLDSTSNASKGSVLLAPSGGNVGIGTSTPKAKLQIGSAGGVFPAFGNLDIGYNLYFDGTNWRRINNQAAAVLMEMQTPGSQDFAIYNTTDGTATADSVPTLNRIFSASSSQTLLSGNVGIGTTSPAALLNLQDSSTTGGQLLISSTAGAAATAGITFRTPWSSTDYDGGIYSSYYGSTVGANDVAGMTLVSPRDLAGWGFKFNSKNGTTRLFIDSSNGNVGVGTTTPGARLEVSSGTANVSGLKFTNFNSSAPTTAGQPVGVDASGNLVTVAVSGSGTVNSGTANQLAFYSSTGSAVSGNANVTASNGVLTLGQTGSVIGGLNLAGNTSGVVSINPQAAAGTYNFNLPITAGTSGQVLTSGGGVAAPMTWTTLAASATSDTTNAANITSGTLNAARLPTVPVTAGGTGLTTLAANSLLYGNGTGNMNALAPVNSAVLTSSGGGVPQWSSLTADIFTQYALLAGRAGGQTLNGGTAASDNLTLDSTASATKGNIILAPSGGSVGIGTSSPPELLSINAADQDTRIRISNTSSTSFRNVGVQIYNWAGTTGDFPSIDMTNSRGSLGSPSQILNGDRLGDIVWRGRTSTGASLPSGIVRVIAAEDYSATTAGADMTFLTTSLGATTSSEKVRITANGYVGIGTTTPGVSLDISAKTDALALPKGTTAQQPGSPVAGWVRYNTSNSAVEFYNGTAWTTLSSGGAGTYLSTSGGTLSGALTISSGGASITGGINNNSGGITSAGSITGVGANITGAGAMTVAAGGAAQNLTLSSSTSGSVNVGSGNGTSLSVLDGGASTVNYITIQGKPAGSSPEIATAGADSNINLTFTPKGTGSSVFSSGNVGIGTTTPSSTLQVLRPDTGGGNLAVGHFESASNKGSSIVRVKSIGVSYNVTDIEQNSSFTGPFRFSSTYGDTNIVNGTTIGSGNINFVTGDGSSMGIAMTIGSYTRKGNVGIGTTGPVNKLDVAGGTAIGTYAGVNAAPSGGLIVSGNVGIGTTLPSDPLHVAGNLSGGTVSARVTNFDNTNSGSNAKFMVQTGGASGGNPYYSLLVSSTSQWTMGIDHADSNKFKISGAASTSSVPGINDRLTIDTSGNVGIGTTSPANLLDVVGGVSQFANSSGTITRPVVAYNTYAAAAADKGAGLRMRTSVDTGYIDSAQTSTTATDSYMTFTTRTASAMTEKMRIDNNGRVGIGTTNPAVSLDISAKTDAFALPKGTTAQQPGTPTSGWVRYNTDNNAVEFYNGSVWTTLAASGGSYLSTTGGTLSGALTISSGGASITGGLNNNSGGITNAGSITGVGANITGTGALTVAAGGTAQNLTLSSSTSGSVNVGSGNGTSLSVLDGGASTVDYVTVKGSAAGGTPQIATAGTDTNINLAIMPKGTGNVGIGTTSPLTKLQVGGTADTSANTMSLVNDGAATNTVGLFLNKTAGTSRFVALGTSGAMHFGANSVGNTNANIDSAAQMTITNGGNVGIGTTSPAGLLDVYSGAGKGRIMLGGVNGISIPTSDPNSLAIGNGALNAMTTTGTYNNSAVGFQSLMNNTTGSSQTAVGFSSLKANTTGNVNSAFGANSLAANTTGIGNSAFGASSLTANTTGLVNSAFGLYSLRSNTIGSYNAAMGWYALSGLTTGSANVAIGSEAGRYQGDLSTDQTGSTNSIFIGRGSMALTNADDNSIVIGTYAAGLGSNSVVLGNSSITKTALFGNVGIGTTTPGRLLHVTGPMRIDPAALPGTPAAGDLAIDSGASNALKYYNGSAWVSTGGGGGSGTVNSGTANQMAFYSSTGTAVSGTANVTATNGVLALGQAGSVIGGLNLSGNTSGTVSINPQAAAGTYNFNLPTTAGTSGQVLASGGGAAAAMTWTTLAASATTDTTNAANIASGTLGAARLPAFTGDTTTTAGSTVTTTSKVNGVSYPASPSTNTFPLVTGANTITYTATSADTFTQYALLAGRAGGQTLQGGTASGNDLTLESTSNATKGAITIAAGSGLNMASGAGQFSQTYTGTTTSASTLTADSVTTAAANAITANGLTSGSIMSLSSTSTAAAAGNKGLDIAVSGANGTASIKRTGLNVAVTATGTTNTNVGASFSASGATNNYGLLVPSGNVGIGTTTPVQLLDVNGSSRFTSTMYTNGIFFSNASVSSFGGISTTANDSTKISIGHQSGNGNHNLVFTSAGNWSLNHNHNTLSPNPTVFFHSATSPTVNSTEWGSLSFEGTGAGGGYFKLRTGTGDISLMPASGNVGIGTTTPGYKLDVQGGDINASGSVRAAGVALTSDVRFKRDIQPIENALDKILNIRGVSYNWRTDEFPQKHFNERHQIGVIAQEVETQLPEVVDTNKEGFKSVNYPALVAPVIEAIKTLYNRIIGVEVHQGTQDREMASVKADNAQIKVDNAQLKAENAELKKENAEIKARLEKIEKMLNSK